MVNDAYCDEPLPADVPACYIIELTPGRFVVCDTKLVLQANELEFAREVFDRYARSHGNLLPAAPLPAHLTLTRYSGQAAR